MKAIDTKLAANIAARKRNFVDVFAGCGGLSLGLMQAGWNGLFAIEQDSNAFETLKANLIDDGSKFRFSWPQWLPISPLNASAVLTDYRKELSTLAGSVDLLAGGPPCQGFSCAGRRDPNDPRNQLIKTYLEIVAILQPTIVLIENVRGITADFEDSTSPNGTINYAEWLTTALGHEYKVSSKMVDTSEFGVPQRRHRYFVVGVKKKSVPTDLECPFTEIEGNRFRFLKAKGLSSIPVDARAAISDLEREKNGVTPCIDSVGFDAIAYRKPLTSYQRLMNAGCKVVSDTRLAKHKPSIISRFKQIIEICHAQGRLNVSLSRETRESFGLKKCAIRVLDPENPSPTITSMPDDLIHYREPRILTVRETARLQSFPDWFAFKGKYTSGGHRRRKEVPRFTQVANAVPPLVAEAIGQALLAITSAAEGERAPQPTRDDLAE